MTDQVDANAAHHRRDGCRPTPPRPRPRGVPDPGAESRAAIRNPMRRRNIRAATAWSPRADAASVGRVASAARNSRWDGGFTDDRALGEHQSDGCLAPARRAVPRALRKSLWSQAIRATMPPGPRPSGVAPIPSSNRAIGPKPRTPSVFRPHGRERLRRLRRLLYPCRLRSVLTRLAPDTAVGRSSQHAAGGRHGQAGHASASQPLRVRAVHTTRYDPAACTQPNRRESTTPGACGLSERASKVALRPAPRTSTDSLDEPSRWQCRVGEHPQLATPGTAAAQRKEPVARAQRGSHRVLDHREPAERPASWSMVAAHLQRVG